MDSAIWFLIIIGLALLFVEVFDRLAPRATSRRAHFLPGTYWQRLLPGFIFALFTIGFMLTVGAYLLSTLMLTLMMGGSLVLVPLGICAVVYIVGTVYFGLLTWALGHTMKKTLIVADFRAAIQAGGVLSAPITLGLVVVLIVLVQNMPPG